jgi:hypothetical protein
VLIRILIADIIEELIGFPNDYQDRNNCNGTIEESGRTVYVDFMARRKTEFKGDVDITTKAVASVP